MSLADVSGAVASALTVIFAWPQALRALRAPSTAGISLGSVLLMLSSGLLWTSYGLLVESAFITVANLSVSFAAALTASACAEGQKRVALLLVPVALTTVAVALGVSVVGLAGVVAAGAMTLPQAMTAPTGRTSLEAVSPATYTLLAVNAGCWIVHGAAIADPLVVAPNCLSLPAACLILWRRARSSR
jgi:uncharacterized protein with PQ loop repeat